MDDGATKTVAARDGRMLAYLEVGDPNGPLVIHNHGGPSSRLEARLFADCSVEEPAAAHLRGPARHRTVQPPEDRTYAGWADDLTTIADALGYRAFGVTGWSEGGPWALAAAAYIDPLRLRHVSSIAGGSYGAFGDNWAADQLSKADAMGGTLALRFKPGFRLMYAALGLTAKRFRKAYVEQLRQSRERLRSTDPASTGSRNRFRRHIGRMLRARQRRAGARQRAPLPALGFRRDKDRTAGPHVAGNG